MNFLGQLDINLVNILLHLGLAIAMLIIGRWLARLSRPWLVRSMQRYELPPSLIDLVSTIVYYSILILAVSVALGILGVPIEIIIGALAIIVIVLAITLQNSLKNLAATVNFILFKPFVVGDLIKTEGFMGIVKEIQLFSTVIISPNHETYTITNAAVQDAGITNFSKLGSIRIDQAFRISYASDIEVVQKVISDVLAKDGRVLEQPPAQVFVSRLAEDHIEITIRPFVAAADYFTFQVDVVREVMRALDETGIPIPLPQQEVRLLPQS